MINSGPITDTGIDQQYSESYDNFQGHELILRDRSSLTAYYDAIMNSKHLFQNKVIQLIA